VSYHDIPFKEHARISLLDSTTKETKNNNNNNNNHLILNNLQKVSENNVDEQNEE